METKAHTIKIHTHARTQTLRLRERKKKRQTDIQIERRENLTIDWLFDWGTVVLKSIFYCNMLKCNLKERRWFFHRLGLVFFHCSFFLHSNYKCLNDLTVCYILMIRLLLGKTHPWVGYVDNKTCNLSNQRSPFLSGTSMHRYFDEHSYTLGHQLSAWFQQTHCR